MARALGKRRLRAARHLPADRGFHETACARREAARQRGVRELLPGAERRSAGRLARLAPEPIWLWGNRGLRQERICCRRCAPRPAQPPPTFPWIARSALPPQALRGFESCRVLCVDDADAVAGDLGLGAGAVSSVQRGSELRTRMIFAARAAPRHIDWRLEDWRSRAAACIVYQVHELDEAGRARGAAAARRPARPASCRRRRSIIC